HVTLLEFDVKLRADDVLQRKLRSLPNVTILTSAQTTKVLGDGKRVTGLVYTDRSSGESREVALEGIFVQIGLLPNTEWLKGTVGDGAARATAPGRGECGARGAAAAWAGAPEVRAQHEPPAPRQTAVRQSRGSNPKQGM